MQLQRNPPPGAVGRWAVVAAMILFAAPVRTEAVIVTSTADNVTPPADDPGFENVSDSGSSMVYLGDSWVLTARHVGIPNSATFDDQTYPMIPNTAVTLHNPSGMELSHEADLRMFRINGNPDLPMLPISVSPPPIGGQVTMIGRGRQRESTPSYWNVQRGEEKWAWTETTATGEFSGYKVLPRETREKRWGTNRIANDDPIRGENDPGHTTVIELGGGANKRHTISLLTLWDEFGGTPNEAQATAGDSGGGVFYKRSGKWELAGIMNAVLTYPDQTIGWAIFGQATSFADLSTYRDEIVSIMASSNYSVMGDINLDGVVSGDGTGEPEHDDLTAFIEGWLTWHPFANIDSWKLGDLNQDRVTDLHDYRLLRDAHPAAAAIAPALTAIGGVVVPEPGTMGLALVLAFVALTARRLIPWKCS